MANRDLVVHLIGDDESLRRAFTRSSASTKQFNREFSAATRGVAAGSGVFRSLGRSIVFASGGFLAFGGVAAFLRKSVDAAKEAQVANAQLAQQLASNGQAFNDYRAQIDKTIFRLSTLAGIEDDELKAGLTTILRTVPNVGKALRDLGTATDLAKARHISLATAAAILGKAEAGNLTLLRRQLPVFSKTATVEEALAAVRAKVAGQALAGTTAQERFGAVLHQTEEIIGTALLPTLNKYLLAGTRWLQQMNETGRLQKNVESTSKAFASAVSVIADVVKGVDRVTGSFKNTLELLAALKISSVILGWAGSLGVFSTRARTAEERSIALRGALSRLAAIGVITIGSEVLLNKKSIDKSVNNFLDSHGLGFLGSGTVSPKGLNLANIDEAIAKAQKFDDDLLAQALKKYKAFLESQDAKAAAGLSATRAEGPHGAALLAQQIAELQAADTKKAAAKGLTASQRNTFFDNTIARILLRGGLGNIQEQIAALQKADSLISARLRITKDVTRRLNLEDQLLQNQAQIKSLQGEQTAQRLAAQEEARQKAIDALQAKTAARTARQFRELGLTSTGDDPVAGVAGLKRRLAQLTSNIDQSTLNTPKLRTELARFRKVLSEGIVPRDVRAKIAQMMDDIAAQLKSSMDGATKNLTKFKHTNANALLAGLGLDAETTRILRQRLAQVGAGGTVPGTRSAAFSAAGAGTTVIPLTVTLDGKTIAQNTTTHQRRQQGRRTESRRGPYAGRH